jgi:hypothetical protein
MENKEFHYTYTALTGEERREIASIRKQYQAPDLTRPENKIERLKALNARVKNTANVFGLVLGVVGILVFGLGLTMILEWSLWLYGVIVMIAGAIPTSLAYPVYRFALRRNKNKYGDEIVKLCEEVLQEK